MNGMRSLRRTLVLKPALWLVRLLGSPARWSRSTDEGAFDTPSWLNPRRPWMRHLRGAHWRAAGVRMGNDVRFSDHVKLVGPARLQVGSGTRVLNHVILDARGGLTIGENSQIGFQSIVLTSSHRFERFDQPIVEQGMTREAVRIGSNVWLGTRVIVLPGVTIGDDAIVGAASVVTRDLPARAIAAGNPARVLRERDER